MVKSKDSLGSLSKLSLGGRIYNYFDLKKAAQKLGFELSKLPYSLRILFENALRSEDDINNDRKTLEGFGHWIENKTSNQEVAFMPARVLMQDFTGVPAVVDLAAMRDAVVKLGGDPLKINPLIPVDLVIDHSVQADFTGSTDAFAKNVELEMKRNKERYEFLRWGAHAFENFRVVPPGTGICHQVNLEYLAQVVWLDGDMAYPDTLVGTDSHTTMVNGLSVLGWGVGGIEAEAAMLGQSLPMIIPEVIGLKLTGIMPQGITATDLVLTVTQMLRKKGVVGKFVEYFGPGLASLALADRATIANMAPEYGATCGFFPVDAETIKYLKLSGRDESRIALVEEYAKIQGLWRDESSEPVYTDVLELNLSSLVPSLAGPKRPQDRVALKDAAKEFNAATGLDPRVSGALQDPRVKPEEEGVINGDVVIAAITSCTNTSNPSVMIAAGLVAKRAVELGITKKPWVKASLAPGSKVVTEYLRAAGLDKYLDQIGFNLVGYGCTTCIGNSGPLAPEIEAEITKNDLTVASVLSGNRNFEGRVHPLTKANYLASPPLVVAYALLGTMLIDITTEPLGVGLDGKLVYLKDIWPSNDTINKIVESTVKADMFKAKYSDVFSGDDAWKAMKVTDSPTYKWDRNSTYINNPPYFEGMSASLGLDSRDLKDHRIKPEGNNALILKILAIFGDSITTDHISPAGNISKTSPAAKYLTDNGVEQKDFNSYGSRRGNHEVMMRGTFANIRIKNEMCRGVEGGFTMKDGKQMTIYDAAMDYKAKGVSSVIFAGKEYGSGSSRDWAAKGPMLLGVKVVIAESFERIHRSNLVGMGILPLTFTQGMTRMDLNLDGSEEVEIKDFGAVEIHKKVQAIIRKADGSEKEINLELQINTENEVEYIANGGILQRVVRGRL
jgi:aconitate hydratase